MYEVQPPYRVADGRRGLEVATSATEEHPHLQCPWEALGRVATSGQTLQGSHEGRHRAREGVSDLSAHGFATKSGARNNARAGGGSAELALGEKAVRCARAHAWLRENVGPEHHLTMAAEVEWKQAKPVAEAAKPPPTYKAAESLVKKLQGQRDAAAKHVAELEAKLIEARKRFVGS